MGQLPVMSHLGNFGAIAQGARLFQACYTTNGPGPSAGGEFAEVEVETTGTEDLWLAGTKIGTATEFVKFGKHRVVASVAIYVQAMITAAAAEEKPVLLALTDGFRTMADQQGLERRLGNVNTGGLAATPGKSNHQNGIAIDINWSGQNGKVFEWMVKNAYRFGFIRTYGRERWHWEYWGDWSGQEKPEWAKHPRWTERYPQVGGHQPRTMFSALKRIHQVGNPASGGGKYPLASSSRWIHPNPIPGHMDQISNGMSNSWVGYDNDLVPDKLDRIAPGWDKPPSIPTGQTQTEG